MRLSKRKNRILYFKKNFNSLAKTLNFAIKNGIRTLIRYFDKNTSKLVLKKFGKAKIITATNVFAHIENVNLLMKNLLRILKDDERLKYIPTIILTTSSNRKDLLDCFNIGIAGYIIKPLKYDDYVYKLKSVLDYWSINELIKV